jgi:hypothetical protein
MRSSRRGAHAVEFAIIFPIWLAIVIAIMEFGWLFFNVALLDAAADIGCRAGSLIDPGNADERIALVEARTTSRMRDVLVTFGAGECATCEVRAETVGAPPSRTLLCEVSREVDPLTTLMFGTRTLRSVQVSRLEWQREAAPE